jgi:hypothetical protein
MALTKVIGAGLGTVTDNADFDGTLNVQGETTLQTHLNMGDNDTIKLGASADLQINHNSSSGNSFIKDVGAGMLILGSDGTGILLQKTSGETMGQFLTDGAVELHHDNSKKFETTSTGVYVTGAIRVGADNAANELDDYEEGTFTPNFVNVNAPTYSSQVGKYTKIGNAVHCTLSIDVSTGLDTSDGSTVAVAGLPFTAVYAEEATNASLGRYINLLGSKATSVTNFRQTETSILLLEGHDSGVAYNEINSGGFLQMAFTYRSA